MPLHRPLSRLLRPFRAWDRGWSPDREPVWQNDRVIVAGVNTADPLAWRRGVIRPAQLDHLAQVQHGIEGIECVGEMAVDDQVAGDQAVAAIDQRRIEQQRRHLQARIVAP